MLFFLVVVEVVHFVNSSIICSISVGQNMSNSPKFKKCRDCDHKPTEKTTRMQCVKCGGLLRVLRGGFDA